MKRIKFLRELKKNGLLEIVEPNQNVMDSYLEKSKSNLESAQILFGARKLEECVSLAYYGMYSSVLALFFRCGIKCENHSACIIILKEVFDEENLFRDISFAKKERIDKQYYFDFYINKEEAMEMIKKAEEFVVEMRVIIRRLSNDGIKKFRQKLVEIVS